MNLPKIILVGGGLIIIVIVSAVFFSYEKNILRESASISDCDPKSQNCEFLQAVKNKDLHACAKLSSDDARECEMTIRKIAALKSLDPKNCDTLDSSVEAEACKAEISFLKALTSNEAKMCEEIKLAELKTRCQLAFAETR